MTYSPPAETPRNPRAHSPYLRSLKDGRIFVYTDVLAARHDMHPWWDPPKTVAPLTKPLNAEAPAFSPKPAGALTEAEFQREMRLQEKVETPEEIFARMDARSGPVGEGFVLEPVAERPDDAPTDAEFERMMQREAPAPERPETPVLSRTATPVEGTPKGRRASRAGKPTRKSAEADLPPAELENLGAMAPRAVVNDISELDLSDVS